MSESRQNNTGGYVSDVQGLLAGILNLDESARKELVTELMTSVFYAPVKKVAFAEAMKSASDVTEQELVTEAVKNADTLEARKTAVVTAVETARDGKEGEVVAKAVESTSTLDAKKTAAATAVQSADNGGKLAVVTEAANAVGGARTQEELITELQSELKTLPKTIGQMIAWSSVIIVVVILLTAVMAGLGQLSNVEALVTITIAVVSTLAGYSLGAASLLSKQLRELRTLLRKGLE